MFTVIAFLAALACEAPPPPAPQSGGAFLRSQASPSTAPKVSASAAPASGPSATAPAPPPTPSVADLFRERNAREAAAKAAAGPSAAPADGEYHCRRTATSVTCGTDEETMRRTEEEAKAQLDRVLSPN